MPKLEAVDWVAIGKRVKEIRRVRGPWSGKLLPREQLAAAIGVNASTIKRWEAGDTEISGDNLMALTSYAGCDLAWLKTGKGRRPQADAGRISEASTIDYESAGTAGEVFDMKEAAARIAKSLETALRKSELVISMERPKELERQRALVWALKDLARHLKRMGYSMDELFDLTDELAAEIGLPTHPKE